MERCVDALRRRGIRKCHLFVLSGNAIVAAAGWVTRDGIGIMSRPIGR